MITQTLLLFLTSWIIENTEFEKKVKNPNFFFISQEEMSKKACFSSGNCRVQAYYVEKEGIYLINKLNPEDDVCHKSIVLHELIHHYQKSSNKKFDLDEKTLWTLQEKQAIFYQNVFLFQQKEKNNNKGPENIVHCDGGSYLDLQYEHNKTIQ